ncbi:NADH:flavin oxidoreductase/NADH oxidase [Rhodococcus sp. BP-241]|uniref:NADH:flavin oxidoreductase/NADH oxidase n=1 Tax=Rhodococcus sp. BP-241 TaxID=2739441 RepID=UPI001C9A68BF|nr:NADH:flavin oxidoreductase/NADH oxidase [Rhodococcus sp. BP-241]MBY6707683.1 NADH:flavin oxidoreductase/NADH oxidase [Rhodococcus sp. BP-241]
MSALFEPLTLRGRTMRNRIWMSPMMQFAAEPSGPAVGAATDWHFQHLAARIVGGVGLAMMEATAVSPDGRSSEFDLGLWTSAQEHALERIVRFARGNGAALGVQLVHAGRKAATGRPWSGPSWDGTHHVETLWDRVGPSPESFGTLPLPSSLSTTEIAEVVADFAAAAARAARAGVDVLELHGAHGYLIHQFLSPHANTRTDEYGGDFDARARFALEVVDAVRAAWPGDRPLFFRLSATDWLAGDTDDPRPGWTLEDSVRLAPLLRDRGVDLIDVSTGGIAADAPIPVGPGYQVPFSERLRETGIPTATVGLVTDPADADLLVSSGRADAVFLARELLRNPVWAQRAAAELGDPVPYPPQYTRAFTGRSAVRR